MPLITITGLPLTGKSTIAATLVTKLQEKIDIAKANNAPGKDWSIVLHSDKSLGINCQDYKTSLTEKKARGAQMTAVKRDISPKTIVILDSLCYIKGFRYQLFCEAKSANTTSCTVHPFCSLETSLERSRLTEAAWDEQLIKELYLRYEEPDGRNRWDSPLFSVYEEGDLDANEVWNCLVYPSKKPKLNNATAVLPAASGAYLQQLDQITQQAVKDVVAAQNLGQGSVTLGGVLVELPLDGVSLAQLQRARRAFVSLHRVRSVDVDRIGALFGEYLSKFWGDS